MTHEQKPESVQSITRSMLIDPDTRIYRHKELGTLYEVQGLARLEMDGENFTAECCIYLDLDFGRMWVRPVSEFIDGRFERVTV